MGVKGFFLSLKRSGWFPDLKETSRLERSSCRSSNVWLLPARETRPGSCFLETGSCENQSWMHVPTCGELCRHYVRVSGHQRGHYPRVAVAGDADRVGHLKDGVGLLFCAVEQNDGALELLQLVLDLRIAVVHRHVQE